MARVERGRRAAGGPGLVDRAVVRAGGVGAHRGRVHERPRARARRRLEHAREPWTLTASSARSSRDGWISQARWTTASASRKWPLEQSVATSASPSASSAGPPGRRRARPTISVTRGSAASAASTLVPAFPVAPVTTMRMRSACPCRTGAKRRAWRARREGSPTVHRRTRERTPMATVRNASKAFCPTRRPRSARSSSSSSRRRTGWRSRR